MDNENKLIKGKCPNCGGTLEIDKTKDAIVCPYCNTPYIVEKAINNYNVNTINIEKGSNVNITVNANSQGRTDEQILKSAFANMEIKDYSKAYYGFRKLSYTQADNPEIWKNLLICITYDFSRPDITQEELNLAQNFLNNYTKLTKENTELVPLFVKYKSDIQNKLSKTQRHLNQQKESEKEQLSKLKALTKKHNAKHTTYATLLVLFIIVAPIALLLHTNKIVVFPPVLCYSLVAICPLLIILERISSWNYKDALKNQQQFEVKLKDKKLQKTLHPERKTTQKFW